jgi:hypothetical protein
MIARHLRLMVVLVAALAATGCQNTKPPIQTLPPISFANQQPIRLNVAELEVVSEYVPPGRAPNYEHLMPVSPGAAIERWAVDRLKPVGPRGSGIARVTIKDARVIEVPLKTDKGVTGMFKKEQEARYDGSLQVVVEILDSRHLPVGADVLASSSHTRTVPEGMTMNERDRVLYDLSETMAKDIDRQMGPLIRNYLGRWLVM